MSDTIICQIPLVYQTAIGYCTQSAEFIIQDGGKHYMACRTCRRRLGLKAVGAIGYDPPPPENPIPEDHIFSTTDASMARYCDEVRGITKTPMFWFNCGCPKYGPPHCAKHVVVGFKQMREDKNPGYKSTEFTPKTPRERAEVARDLDWDDISFATQAAMFGPPGIAKSGPYKGQMVPEFGTSERGAMPEEKEVPAARPKTIWTMLEDGYHQMLGFGIIGLVIWGGWYGGSSWYAAEKLECQTPKIHGKVLAVEETYGTSGSTRLYTLRFQSGAMKMWFDVGDVIPNVGQSGRVCENGHWHATPPEATPKDGDF